MAATTSQGTGNGAVERSKPPIYNGVVKSNNIDSSAHSSLTSDIRSMIVYVAVDDTTTINEGDFLFLDTDDAKPASDFTWGSDLATTQATFVNQFLGIAKSSHASGDGAVTDFPVDISPFSVITVNCDEETHEIGDKLTLAKTFGVNSITSNHLKKTSIPTVTCARCVERNAVANTTVRVIIQSAYWGINDAGRQ